MQIIVCVKELLCPAMGSKATKPKLRFSAPNGTTKMLQHAARIMKLTAILILGACLHVHAVGFGQKISLSETNVPIEKVFRKIEEQTNLKFLYADHVIKDAKNITITVKDAKIGEVLTMVFTNQVFGYEINENMVFVLPGKNFDNNKRILGELSDPIDVGGKVTDNEGRPLNGANVKVRGTTIGVTTDSEGRFVLKNISENSVLEVSFVGHEMKTFTVKGIGFFNITLDQKLSLLDETVVIGYGTSSRRFTTGNIATVKAADIEKQPVNNPLLALQGRVPGIEITQLSGLNGGGIQVRIQGRNSIQSGLNPLIVIDGVPYPAYLQFSYLEGFLQDGNPLNYVNPNDIESISILKDADATSIYGSRAGNGAILISTKKGKIGKTKFSVNLQHGWGKVTRFANMMNTRQYLDMRYGAYRNSGALLSTQTTSSNNYDLKLWDTTRYTDWQKILIGGTAQYSNVNLGVSGGNAIMQYLLGGTYNRRTTVFPGNFDNQGGTLHLNINTSSTNQKLKLQLTGSYSYDQNKLPGFDLTSEAVRMEPNAPPIYNEDGTLNWAPDSAGISSWENPLARYVNASEFKNITKNLISNIVLSYRIVPGLVVSSSFGYTSLQSDLYNPFRLEYYRPERRSNSQRIASYGNRNMTSWIIEPQIKYERKILMGKFEGLLGSTIQKSNTEALSVRGFGYPTDLLMKTLLAAKSTQVLVSTSFINRFNALFGRLNYNWNDKYIINLTARRDGSNRFGDKNKFHNFWSGGVGWIFSDEKWTKRGLPFLSFGKLRSSYGTTGNDQIPDFSYLSLYNISNSTILYQNNFSLDVQNMANPYLKWEETKKWQVGIDLGILSDRLILGVTYNRNKSSNQLIGYVLPTYTGFNTITKNLPATIQNINWEFVLSAAIIKNKKIIWNTSMNLTLPNNKVLSFPGIELTGYASGDYGIIVGEPVGVIKAYNYAGVHPTNGRYIVYDINGNPTLDPNAAKDKTKLISSLSKYYGGITNSISYKGIQLEFLLQFVRQKGPKDLHYYNGTTYPGQFLAGSSNQPVTVINNWEKPGDIGPVGRYHTSDLGVSNLTSSDFWYSYEASFIRLKNVSFSWQLPSNWLQKAGFQNAALYFRGQNLATVTEYSGIDPESQGIGLPPLQLWTVGMKLEL